MNTSYNGLAELRITPFSLQVTEINKEPDLGLKSIELDCLFSWISFAQHLVQCS